MPRINDKLLRGQFCPWVIRYDHVQTGTITFVYGNDSNRALTITGLEFGAKYGLDWHKLNNEGLMPWITSQVQADGLDVSRMVGPSAESSDLAYYAR